MLNAEKIVLSVLSSLGERAALIALILLAVVFMSAQASRPAFSDDEVALGLAPEGKPPSVTFTPTPTPVPPTPTATPTPTPTLTPTSTPSPTSTPVNTDDNSVWDSLAHCESKGNWSIDTGNGYYGGLQFSQGAWNSVGGSGNPAHASRDEQIARGKALQERRGWGVWGLCAKKLGLN